MENKQYGIFIDHIKIGTTEFEKADAPMGAVFGRTKFLSLTSGYEFFKANCLKHHIPCTDHPEAKLIIIRDIPNIEIINNAGRNISGFRTEISSTDGDYFDIGVFGISYPFYKEEFPHHVKACHEIHF